MTPESFTAWRARLKLDKSKAARALGCSRNVIIGYEKGTKKIPLYMALACAAIALGVPPPP
jgi:transcriptional regulator with XRE-family HTH domain